MSTSTAKMGTLKRAVLKRRAAKPSGVKLSDADARLVIREWKDEVEATTKSIAKLKSVDYRSASHLAKVGEAKDNVASQLVEAKRCFKISKNPLKKEEWARKVLIANKTLKTLVESEKRVQGSIDRAKSFIAEASLVKTMLDTRISEAELYREMNGGLKLVGEALIDAKSRYKEVDFEFENLELGFEHLEQGVISSPADAVIKEAQELVGKK